MLNEQPLARLALFQAGTAHRSRWLVAEARSLWAEGHLSRALTSPDRYRVVVAADWLGVSTTTDRHYFRSGGCRSRCQTKTTRRPTSGARCTVLHVVTKALPEVQVGYTLRTHGIAEAQADGGCDVHVVTRLGFPVDIGVLGGPDRLTRNSVTYHRLQPAGGVPSSAGPRLIKELPPCTD